MTGAAFGCRAGAHRATSEDLQRVREDARLSAHRPQLRRLSAALFCAALFGSCAQKVTVRTPGPATNLVVGEQEVGAVGPFGVQVEIPAGRHPVPFSVNVSGQHVSGEIPRSETNWGLVATSAGLVAACAPAACLGACMLSNPLLLFVPLTCAATSNPTIAASSCAAILATPSWATLPCAATGGVAGLSPLGLLFLAERTPTDFVLEPPAAERTLGPGEGLKGAMAW